MKKPQYITLIVAFAVLGLLWAFGKTKSDAVAHSHEGHDHAADVTATSSFSIDSAIASAKNTLRPQSISNIDLLENSIEKATGNEQKIHAFHQLSQYWKDSVKAFIPYAWYVGEGARLENSEKNLNFAGHLFLNNLQNVENAEISKWMALQAKDLFERSLTINPDNDSAKVGLGSTYMFGGISNAPMEGIAKIREVVEKDSTNIYAQMTLATGSLMSGQTEKAKERLETVTRLDAKNLQAVLMLADVYEKLGEKNGAIEYYQKALSEIDHPEMKSELEKRIKALKEHN